MEINKITSNKINSNHNKTQKIEKKKSNIQQYENSNRLMRELDSMANINNINFQGSSELNLSTEELQKRTNKDYLITKKMLKADAPEYLELAEDDKKALKHLVKAAYILEKINMQLDNPYNLEFQEYLNNEIKKGNKDAEMTKILFDAQKGINALDTMSNKIHLAKGHKDLPGKGFYPEDLTKDEFHKILIKMLNDGKDDEVRKILTQRTVVERKGDELVGIDYIDKFKEDFALMADELDKAANYSTNKEFTKYLVLQALQQLMELVLLNQLQNQILKNLFHVPLLR